jgi:hypothetical protein
LPGVKGFSPTNMNYIKRFYLLYFQLNTIFPQDVGKLSDTENQILSQYELTRLYPADFKGTLPTIEDIENELKGSFNS